MTLLLYERFNEFYFKKTYSILNLLLYRTFKCWNDLAECISREQTKPGFAQETRERALRDARDVNGDAFIFDR